MSTTTSTTTTLNLKHQPTKLEVSNDTSLDKRIEQLIRHTGTLKVGQGDKEAVKPGPDPEGLEILPESSKKRMIDAGIDISKGYPEVPDYNKVPIYLDEAFAIRNEDYPYIERGKNADPEKKALFGAAKEVIDLTKHIGTEIVGLQLADLTDQQKDELALLIAERGVVFFRDQKLSPQKQWDLGDYWGQIEKHAQVQHVPGLKVP
ncbi:unnamed protein product [Ambrosiozyma monospora]|uniref:Unnamed protein product n=1 Tax=Ambrosiozyma monospora TaxID=43982 RepID=A0ACB5TZL1_AMBMO|nr:unnamed protein product [Ambrosiozyma monospora]